eukprot:3934062-Rhodomonas_salina.2
MGAVCERLGGRDCESTNDGFEGVQQKEGQAAWIVGDQTLQHVRFIQDDMPLLRKGMPVLVKAQYFLGSVQMLLLRGRGCAAASVDLEHALVRT